MTLRTRRSEGLTLLETLVATALLGIIAMWTVSGYLAVSLLQDATERNHARLDALETHLYDSLPELRALPHCQDEPRDRQASAGACLERVDACNVALGILACGDGPWRLVTLQARAERSSSRLAVLRWEGS